MTSRKMMIDADATQSNKIDQFDFDLFVIGASSGCVSVSCFAANFVAKVGICMLPLHPASCEVIGGDVGGTCVIPGCVPKKILVYGASLGGEIEDARNYGWELNEIVGFNWKRLLHKKSEEIVRLNGIYKRLLSGAGVKLYEGEGKVVGPNEVHVIQLDGTKLSYTAKHILIATGSRAQRPDIPGKELGITSDDALSLEDLPKRAVILGGGYTAVEFASIWRGMGVHVDLFFRKELPLRGFDDEMGAVVARNLESRGINLHPQTNLTELVKTVGGIKVHTSHGEELVADVVLFATGRLPNSNGLILEAAGVELDKSGAVKVNEYSQTNVPSIWAVGDVTNRMNLTPVALMEGTCVSSNRVIPPLSVVAENLPEDYSYQMLMKVFSSHMASIKKVSGGNTICGVLKHKDGYLCFADSRSTDIITSQFIRDTAIKMKQICSDPNTIFCSVGSAEMTELMLMYLKCVLYDSWCERTMSDIVDTLKRFMTDCDPGGGFGGILISNKNKDNLFHALGIYSDDKDKDQPIQIYELQNGRLVMGSGSGCVSAVLPRDVKFPEEFDQVSCLEEVKRACHFAYLCARTVGGPLRVMNFEYQDDNHPLVTHTTISSFNLQAENPQTMRRTIVMLFEREKFSLPQIEKNLEIWAKKLHDKGIRICPSLWFINQYHVFRVHITRPSQFPDFHSELIKGASLSQFLPLFKSVRFGEISSDVGILDDVVHLIQPYPKQEPKKEPDKEPEKEPEEVQMELTDDRQRLLNRLLEQNLVEFKVPGDGHCQFSALSHQLHQTTEMHMSVRNQVVFQLKSNPGVYGEYVQIGYEDYLAKMSMPGEWGDHITLRAAADFFGMKIIVISSHKGGGHIEILPMNVKSDQVIHLSFLAEHHYNSVYRKQGDI